MKSIIALLAFSVLASASLTGEEIAWTRAAKWQGKSDYAATDGAIVITRPEQESGAGGFLSAFLPVTPAGKRYLTLETRYRFDGKAFGQIAAMFRNREGKEFKYLLLHQESRTGSWQRRQLPFVPPEGAVAVKFILTLNGGGKAEFRNATLTDTPPPEQEFDQLPNGDFLETGNGCPENWFPAWNWQGKSEYSGNGRTAIIRRTETLGAGAFLSARIKAAPETMLQFSGKLRCKVSDGRVEIAVRFFDADNKVAGYRVLMNSAKSCDWQTASFSLEAPPKSVYAILMLVLAGSGEAEFDDLAFGARREPVRPGTANLLLNSSFEESDLDRPGTDCFTVVRGDAGRVNWARHGFHALRLMPGSRIGYGSGAPALTVRDGETLSLHFAAAGAGTAKLTLDFFDPQQTRKSTVAVERLPGGDAYRDFDATIAVPPGAAYAAFSVENSGGGELLLDALYLGERPFEEKFLPPPVPVFAGTPQPDNLKQLPRSSIREYRGVPTWFIGDDPVVNPIFGSTLLTPEAKLPWKNYNWKVFHTGKFPIAMVQAYVTPEESGERYTVPSAVRDLDYQIRLVLSAIPDARIFLWLGQEPTRIFAEQYPDELLEVEERKGKWLYDMHTYSYGSEIWGRYCSTGLEKLLCALRARPYGDRIVGIAPGLGRFGENNWAYATMSGGWSAHDTGRAMTNFFRKWLLREYRGNAALFQKAWDKPGCNFTDAQVPGVVRRTGNPDAFPVEKRDVFDYSRCESFALLHRVLEQVETAKRATGGNLFTMAQFGYFTEGIFHRELDTALKNPYLDALGPAPPYINRGAGDDVMDHGPSASVRAAGKIWFFQADIRTCLTEKWDFRYGQTANTQESINVFLRDIGHYMTTGAIPYYISFSTWYDSPEMWKVVERLDEWMALSSRFPRRSAAEIAVVTSPLSIATGYEYNYQRRIQPPYQSAIGYNRQLEWHHLGAPYDFFLLDDLLASPELDRYKLVVMADTFALTSAQRELIRRKLCANQRTVLWLYAPGYVEEKDGLLSKVAANTAISGFTLRAEHRKCNTAIEPSAAARRDFPGLPDGAIGYFRAPMKTGFTTPDKPQPIRPEIFNPRFSVQPEPGVEILGTYRDGGQPAFARKKFPAHTAFFWGSPALDRDLLAGIAVQARVHLYTDRRAVVYANGNFLSIHVPEAGSYRLRLPRQAEIVFDLYENRALATDTNQLTVTLPKNGSLLLYFGGKNALQEARRETEAAEEQRRRANAELEPKFRFELGEQLPLATAADLEAVFAPDESGFIRHFMLLGPMPLHSFKESYADDWLPEPGKEHSVWFQARDAREKKIWFDGRIDSKELTLVWRPVAFSNGLALPLYAQIHDFFTFEQMSYLLSCSIEVDRDETLTLCVGSDDGHKIYLDGKPVAGFIPERSRSLSIDSEQTPIKLRKGRNLLQIKIFQVGGNVGHAIRFRKDGKIFRDYRIRLK